MPVGFVGAAESKEALIESGLPAIVDPRAQGRQRDGGGRRQCARERGRMTSGRLFGVGIGPGDPELLTVKAVRVIAEAPVVAFFAKAGRRGNARGIVDCWLKPSHVELPLFYPMTTELHFDDPPYREALALFYDESAAAIAAHLTAGRDVALLSEGDPLFYGSFMHLFIRLRERFAVTIVPGVSSICGAWGAAATAMTWGDDSLVVLPATLPLEELIAPPRARRRRRHHEDRPQSSARARQALLKPAWRSARSMSSARRWTGEAIMPLAEKSDEAAPYFSLILVPGRGRRP